MKISWGIKIGVLYGGFVLLILTLVFLSANQKVELESKDYYAKELAYQDRINATHNANALTQSIDYRVNENAVELTISKDLLTPTFSGEVFFYKPDDSSLDKKIPFQFDKDGKQLISTSQFKKGAYKIEISWKCNAVNYYKESYITIK